MHSNFFGLACLPLYLVEFMALNSVRDKDLNLALEALTSCACVIHFAECSPTRWIPSPHPHRNIDPRGGDRELFNGDSKWVLKIVYRNEIISVISSI